ncbi:4-hydroxythreonine-4-phosphate dehydrogenase PdxA [Helcococcus kunzii]|uniref:4-hydroxythreonine-4-phosphate dehydrogenase PdxA n=1 Tax=Helcococcus kunzii TaxID=40091 RepID=UPI001BAFE180|nr:4-hydroxythreonine-4-phosphate dehydrogenase PdxA [Helcococcus kunzii]QUY64054.1 4-hydroxythreonine-4-phosphate dehydrogenase PdxA [Helcococcus kunzii]
MKKIIGITLGDPAGIGPEITLKAFSKSKLYDNCRPLLIGDKSIIEYYLAQHPELNLSINVVKNPEEGKYTHGTIDMIDMGLYTADQIQIGEISALAGKAAYLYVEKVIKLALENKIDATVTNPLNKKAMNLAGYKYAGHTEIYADLTGTEKYTMMLADGNLRVVHISTHVSLREACDLVKKDRIIDVIRIANNACKELGIQKPKIAVAGLNPHAGENGLFGKEEIEEIEPAINVCKSEGIDVYGPEAPDTVFSRANGGMFDIVVAMYHDQGHIPLKVKGFVYSQENNKWKEVKGVNITLGLPIIRVSVDHGTAFDAAGKWTASEVSLENAIDFAIQFAENKKTVEK